MPWPLPRDAPWPLAEPAARRSRQIQRQPYTIKLRSLALLLSPHHRIGSNRSTGQLFSFVVHRAPGGWKQSGSVRGTTVVEGFDEQQGLEHHRGYPVSLERARRSCAPTHTTLPMVSSDNCAIGELVLININQSLFRYCRRPQAAAKILPGF